MTTPGTRELYVYYRVDPARVDAALDAVRRWQMSLAASHVGLSARVLTKHGLSGDAPTFMEIYTAPAGISADLQASIEQSALALGDHLQGSRHVEGFIA